MLFMNCDKYIIPIWEINNRSWVLFIDYGKYFILMLDAKIGEAECEVHGNFLNYFIILVLFWNKHGERKKKETLQIQVRTL